MIKLTAELVPKTAWYSNVRSNVSSKEWDIIRRKVYADANYICEICGGAGAKHPVECHEVWAYDEQTSTQLLIKMIALCPDCHSAKHLGRAKAVGIFDKAIKHLMKVNGWTLETAIDYTNEVFVEWEERSKHNWKLDIKALSKYESSKPGDETW